MTSLAWHPLARRELFEASAYYDGESRGLGSIFLDAVEQALERLAVHPRAGRRVLGATRSYLIARFPYSLVYRIEKASSRERLFVLAVAHHKRRPRYWAGRS